MNHVHSCPLCYEDEACALSCSVDVDDDGRPRGACCVCGACMRTVEANALALANHHLEGNWSELQTPFLRLARRIENELPAFAKALRVMILDITNRRLQAFQGREFQDSTALAWSIRLRGDHG